jgi:hypothetical protein
MIAKICRVMKVVRTSGGYEGRKESAQARVSE